MGRRQHCSSQPRPSEPQAFSRQSRCVSCARCVVWGHLVCGRSIHPRPPILCQCFQSKDSAGRCRHDRAGHRLTLKVLWRQHKELKAGTAQTRPTSRSRLCTNPVVCLSGIPNSTFKLKHVWITTSLNCYCRPRLPFAGGTQAISGSNQLDSDPHRFKLSFVRRPVLCLVLRGGLTAHALKLSCGIHEMNPQQDLCHKASKMPQSSELTTASGGASSRLTAKVIADLMLFLGNRSVNAVVYGGETGSFFFPRLSVTG